MRHKLHQADRKVCYRDANGNKHTITAYTPLRLEYVTGILTRRHIIWWLERVYRSG